ncbi:MAG: aryl-sulfate sulfotransferase, partial [Myxococcota bacterium]
TTPVGTATATGATPPVDGCPPITGFTVELVATNPLERRLRVALDGETTAWAECTAGDDPLEDLLAESTVPSDAHELVIRGLRAGTRYTCAVHPGCGGPARIATFTPVAPASLPPFTVETSGEGPSEPYTLINTQASGFADAPVLAIVDPDGAPRWVYEVGEPLVIDLDAEVEDGGTSVHLGGGWAYHDEDHPTRGVFRDVDLSGRTLLERTTPAFGIGWNHHSEKLDDGSYLSLTFSENTGFDKTFYGVGVEQWHPVTGLGWTWSSQGLVDAGEVPDPGDDVSPYHANSVSFVDDAWGPAAWISLYKAREIWRIDRATGERTHVFGPNGTFTLLDADGAPLGDDQWTYVQHDPDYTDDGRAVMYDNGQERPVPVRYSRVVELQFDLDANTATLLWTWTEPNWFDPVLGDADYLPNGNILVTKGFSESWTPTRDDVSQVLELKLPDEVVWRLSWTNRWPTFRASRYDGCALFANARYCPAVATRLAALRGT